MDRPLRWLFLNPVREGGWGGMEGWMLRLAGALKAMGDDCLIVGRTGTAWPRACAERGLCFRSVPFGGDLSPRTWWALAAIARSWRPDIAIAKGFRQARWLRAFARPATVAVKMPGGHELADDWFHRWTVRCCVDRILVDSHATRAMFLRRPWLLPDEVIVAHNGVVFEEMPPCSARRAAVRAELLGGAASADLAVVAVVGRLTADKGVADALEAFARGAAGREAVLAVIGDGPQRPALEARAAQPDLRGRVHWLGWRNDARHLLAGADLLLHASRVEGLPNAVLEAMAAGLPVVATNAGGTPEAVVQNVTGLLAAVGDVPALADALHVLLADPMLRRRMGAAALERVRREFTVDAMVSVIRCELAKAAANRREAAAPVVVQEGAWRVAGSEDLSAAARRWLEGDAVGWTTVKCTHRVRVACRQEAPVSLYVKHFISRTPRDRLGSGLRRPRALANYRTAHALAAMGVEVVPHLAAAWRRRRWTVESVLFTQSVPGATTIDEWTCTRPPGGGERRRVARRAGEWLASLHEAWVAPHDLKVSNILVTSDGRLVLLDLDNCVVGRPPLAREAARNLFQILRSFDRSGTLREWKAFLAAYRRRRRWSRQRMASLLEQVVRRWRRRRPPPQ